jgi:hypothetical protein
MKRSKFLTVVVVLILVAVIIWYQVFRTEFSGPVSVETVSDDGMLKLTMTLEKTRFSTNPREPIRINLTLTNLWDNNITLTFHYKSKFDFMVYEYALGDFVYKWSYEKISGPAGWGPNVTSYPTAISLEPPEINTVTLRPGESITDTLIWDQYYDAWTSARPRALAIKGKYRIIGYAGFANVLLVWAQTTDNPDRYFEYISKDGSLVRVVLETPGIDIVLE